ncbi:MAG: alpha/beta hydrolase [Pseudolabrys sp.]
MATFVVAHGAWSAGWGWKKMRPLMAARRHAFFVPTLTGVGDRSHLAHADIDLDTHVADVCGVLQFEDLSDVILIGHSYGGMVATGVADRARDRVAKLVYIDAFAPTSGESAFDLLPASVRDQRKDNASGDWRMPPGPMPPDTPAADRAWAGPKRVPQPIKTFEQKLVLTSEPPQPRHYIYCRRCSADDRFRRFYDRGKSEGWKTYEIDSSHNPHITCPDVLMEMIEEIARG